MSGGWSIFHSLAATWPQSVLYGRVYRRLGVFTLEGGGAAGRRGVLAQRQLSDRTFFRSSIPLKAPKDCFAAEEGLGPARMRGGWAVLRLCLGGNLVYRGLDCSSPTGEGGKPGVLAFRGAGLVGKGLCV